MKHYQFKLTDELIFLFLDLMKSNFSILFTVDGEEPTLTDAESKLRDILKKKKFTAPDIKHLIALGSITESESSLFIDKSKVS